MKKPNRTLAQGSRKYLRQADRDIGVAPKQGISPTGMVAVVVRQESHVAGPEIKAQPLHVFEQPEPSPRCRRKWFARDLKSDNKTQKLTNHRTPDISWRLSHNQTFFHHCETNTK
jgi:hypothetical protein